MNVATLKPLGYLDVDAMEQITNCSCTNQAKVKEESQAVPMIGV